MAKPADWISVPTQPELRAPRAGGTPGAETQRPACAAVRREAGWVPQGGVERGAGRTGPGPRRRAEQQGRSANSSGKTETATRGGSALEQGRKKDTPYAALLHVQVGFPQYQTELPGQPSDPGGGAQAGRY